MSGPRLTRRGAIAAAAAASFAPRLALAAGKGKGTPVNLRVEWRRQPLGIDTQRPRFRWTMASAPEARGVRQSAWRLVVAGRRC